MRHAQSRASPGTAAFCPLRPIDPIFKTYSSKRRPGAARVGTQPGTSLLNFGATIAHAPRVEPPKPEGWLDEDHAMIGDGEAGPGCGDPFTEGCMEAWEFHPRKRRTHQCALRACPTCAREDDKAQAGAWLKKKTREFMGEVYFAFRVENARPIPYGNGRLDLNRNRMDLRKPRIFGGVLSPPQKPHGYTRAEVKALTKKANRYLRERGYQGFVLVAHAFRHDETDEPSPEAYNRIGFHWHVVGVARWVMGGAPTVPKRGRPEEHEEGAQPHLHDARKGWVPINTQRQEVEGWVYKTIWFMEPVGNGWERVLFLSMGGKRIEFFNGGRMQAHLIRTVHYLFHHATYFRGHYTWVENPEFKFDKHKPEMKKEVTPGRHPTPSCMAYGLARQQPQNDDERRILDEVQAIWGPQAAPCCEECGAALQRVYDDAESEGAKRYARTVAFATH